MSAASGQWAADSGRGAVDWQTGRLEDWRTSEVEVEQRDACAAQRASAAGEA